MRRNRLAVLSTQPWAGLGGLVLSAIMFFALALGLGNTATSLLVLGPMTVFAVSGVATIGFWWNDWPGSRLNKPWTGLTDTALIAGAGVVLTIAGEAIVERPDLRAFSSVGINLHVAIGQRWPLPSARTDKDTEQPARTHCRLT